MVSFVCGLNLEKNHQTPLLFFSCMFLYTWTKTTMQRFCVWFYTGVTFMNSIFIWSCISLVLALFFLWWIGIFMNEICIQIPTFFPSDILWPLNRNNRVKVHRKKNVQQHNDYRDFQLRESHTPKNWFNICI